ncbi:glycosyltransferase WbuB [Flavobacterium noncentrifugens]|uniref:Glycosyltransferase involved in cell wall bisynthesis n=1 Tax=Flavobacterium noncentrifugens TaxID=1128970 RepID=A0A1G8T0Y0_9FLAO|nr:glycosyltransferase family 4 protein [Flavobacterium noncentrifugens]GEP50043.1 glycosyltransferase WbuB [Flavobacterium noncentrifugens]SDJ35103.1 Glycosyltransferase involved in cell wall bisynthesis [Flavobacterium noncentrifugens]
MEDILIVSNYYPPEKGAAANRIEQLALKLYENNYTVSVVCPLPNYPKGQVFPTYKKRFFVKENFQNVTVSRLWIYPSISKNIFKRILSILSFAVGLFFYLLFAKTPKKVIVQSPPLLLSFISVFVLSLKGKKIILNVSDLWPLAAIELDALKAGSFSHKVSLFFERYIYKRATLILGQSNEIITHIHEIFPQKPCYLYRNFPDHHLNNFEIKTSENPKIQLFYAGLLGVAQGVLEVCEKMKLESLNFEFHIFGDGAEKTQIETYIKNHPEKNIVFHGMLERNDLIEKLATADIALVPLKTRIYGSVPSKIFEYSALGIPILYFGGGEGETIVENNNLGWVAKVEDFNSLNAILKSISDDGKNAVQLRKENVYKQSSEHFNLDVQIRNLIQKNVF